MPATATATRRKKQPARAKVGAISYPITIPFPKLNPGEKFVGVIVSADGKYRHALILLPGESEPNNWKAQMEWAASIGGDLPDRVEGALLFATLRDEFKGAWYWTRELHAAYSDYAWMQSFGYGYQLNTRKSYDYRARAVRRAPLVIRSFQEITDA